MYLNIFDRVSVLSRDTVAMLSPITKNSGHVSDSIIFSENNCFSGFFSSIFLSIFLKTYAISASPRNMIIMKIIDIK